MTRPDMKKRVCWQTLKTSPLFAVLFPNSITIVKTSNEKQLRPTTMATLLGNKILFLTLFYSSLLCTLQCEIICYPWFSSSCTFMPTMHWSGNVLLKKANNLTACWSEREREHGRREREGLVTLPCSLPLPCPSCPTLATTKSCADHCNCHYCYWPLLPLLLLSLADHCYYCYF